MSPIVSEPTVKKLVVETSEAKASKDKPKAVRKNNGSPIIKDYVSNSEEEDIPQAKIQKKTVKPSFAKIEFVKSKKRVKSPRKKIVKQSDQNRQNTHSPRGNQRNWNNMISQRLGSNFEMINKAFYGNPQMDLQDQGVIDSGCSRPMDRTFLSINLRLGHINFKTMDKLVKGNLVRGLLSKLFENDQTCVACQKGKQHRASCKSKTIKGLSVARTPQQNRVAERKNITLIEAVRTMLADSKLPTTFWAEADNTACYVQNRVLVTKPHNKSPYELFLGRKPAIGFMRPFGCPVTIHNTIDHLGEFDGKADEGFFIGYSINSKAFRVFNSRTRIVEENLHVQFSENTPNIAGSGLNWLFDIDALTKSINYKPVVAENQSNSNAGTKACDDAGKAKMETIPGKDYILLPLWTDDPPFSQSLKSSPDVGFKPSGDDEKKVTKEPGEEGGDSSKNSECSDQEKEDNVNNTNNVNAVSTKEVNTVGGKTSIELPDDPNMPELEDIVYLDDDEDVGVEADMSNLNAFMPISAIPTTRIHKGHPVEQIIRDLNSAPQTRRMTKNLEEHGLFSSVQQRTNHKDFQNFLFACFLSQEELKKVIHALKDPSWIEAMQEELLQFKLQEVWTLIDVKSAFLYGKIEEEVYRGKIDKTLFIRGDKGDILLVQVYVDDIIFSSTKKSLCIEFEKLMHKKFQMSSMGELIFFLGPQVKQKEDGIFISQDKYVTDSFGRNLVLLCKDRSNTMETQKLLLKDEDGLWYPKDSLFDLVACTDSDYAGASLDRKSTTGVLLVILNTAKLMLLVILNAAGIINIVKILIRMELELMLGKLMLLGINLLLLGKVNAARHKLTTAVEISFLAKPAESEGFEQIVDFLNAHTIKYALTVNPTIYTSCIEQFWATVKMKTVNGEVQLQALVDGKKIIVTEASVRRDLQLNDKLTFYKAFFSPQWKFLIHTILQCLSAKTTAWDEFSSTMASAIICLATNQKFNFSKYIFESMVKNLDNAGKFLMYPRKGFSGRETPLFPTMVVQNQAKMGEGLAIPTDPHHTPIQPSTSQPQKKQRSRRPKRKDTEVPQPSRPTDNVEDEAVYEERDDSLERAATIATGLDAEQDKGNINKT
ncbi:putative ribonuclease H-like domain-containing protein [Tanacetum coccineum]